MNHVDIVALGNLQSATHATRVDAERIVGGLAEQIVGAYYIGCGKRLEEMNALVFARNVDASLSGNQKQERITFVANRHDGVAIAIFNEMEWYLFNEFG